MEATITTVEQGGILRLSGSADYQAAAELREAFDKAIAAFDGKIVCDLTELEFICSDALSVFICAHLAVCPQGGYLRLVNPQQRVQEVFETTRLDKVFGVFDSAEAARAAPVSTDCCEF